MSNLKIGPKIYEGKAKIIFEGSGPDRCIHEFKDSLTAFNGAKKIEMQSKGELNCKISSKIFSILNQNQIPTHFIQQLDSRRIETWRLEMLPVEVVLRNRVAGSLAKKLPPFEGRTLQPALVEFFWKKDEFQDPQISEALMLSLLEISKEDIDEMKSLALRVNEIMSSYFSERGLLLVDFKLEFGKREGRIYLADEMSPDTCRLWDQKTNQKLDKDRFRLELGQVIEAYQEVAKRMECL